MVTGDQCGPCPNDNAYEESEMQIDKDMILKLLRSRGDHEKASQAQQELPDKVDDEEHAGLLEKFGVEPKEVLGKLGGLGGMFDKS
jgi:hypothetical protein